MKNKEIINALILFLAFAFPAIGQDSLAQTELRAVFMGLAIEKDHEVVFQEAIKSESFKMTKEIVKSPPASSSSEGSDALKLVFEKYNLLPDNKCSNCYISSHTIREEKVLSLVLNFENFNQEHYNELLKTILTKITPQVKKIEPNIDDLKNGGTLLFLDKKQYTPRIVIAEPSKAFTQIRMEYITSLEKE